MSEEEEEKIQQAINNIIRGEDIDSATYIVEKCVFDNVIFLGKRVNYFKTSIRQVLNFIKRYKESDYETICLENNNLIEINKRLEAENKELKEKAFFMCDPSKNKKCKKTSCYINNGECMLTTDMRYSKKYKN